MLLPGCASLLEGLADCADRAKCSGDSLLILELSTTVCSWT